MDWMMDGTDMMGMCLIMLVGIIVIIAVTGYTVYIVARQLIKKCKVEDAPLRQLNERYVRGEINDEEYNQKYSFLTNRFRS
ncbi:SHOCT domain-containing protein [Paenibacillus sp. BR2-3]|uniref:SHOCT domain-containing protein n=1 Tax=Paenibacillus sp. BR2-3 TaxID=3048494 RepID=UPI0039777E19